MYPGDRNQLKAFPDGIFFQELHVSFPAPAEMEIFPDDDQPGFHSAEQNIANKFLSRETGKIMIEMDDHGVFYVIAAECGYALIQSLNHRGFLAVDYIPGMREKGDEP